MLRATFRTAVQASLLSAVVVLAGLAVHSRQALPAEKGDLIIPVPQPKPSSQNPLCKAPFAELSRAVPGWRVLTNEKAMIYLASSLKEDAEVPPFDSIAYLRKDQIIVVLVLYHDCVVGKLLLPAKTHEKAMERATGIIV